MEKRGLYLFLFSLTLLVCSLILGISFVKGCSALSVGLQVLGLS